MGHVLSFVAGVTLALFLADRLVGGSWCVVNCDREMFSIPAPGPHSARIMARMMRALTGEWWDYDQRTIVMDDDECS